MTEEEKITSATSYSKQQFLQSKKFTPQQKDVLCALLDDSETYTIDQAEKLISNFLRKKVT